MQHISRSEQSVGLSEAKIHKEEKSKTSTTKRISMSKTSWNYNDIESYHKWFNGQKKYTANRNARKLQQFCGWIKKTPERLIAEYEKTTNKKVWQRDRKKEIEGFYNHLIEKGYKINSARTMPSGVLSFYSRNCETVKDATKLFAPPQIPENELIFTKEMLRKAYYYADLEGQTLLSLATCLGYSSADFLTLECEKLQNLVKEAEDKNSDFIQFIGKSRKKTSVQPRSHLTPEALHNLKDYLAVLKKNTGHLPKFLWNNDKTDEHITNEGLNKKVKRILEQANIDFYGKTVRFHLFRKFLYSNLQAKNRDIAKVITAKKVSASDLTYIPNINSECFRVFKETYKDIALNGNLTGKTNQKQQEQIANLQNAVITLTKDLQGYKTVSETQTQEIQNLSEGNKKLETKFKMMKARQNSHINLMLNFVIDNLDLSEEKQREIRKRFLIRRTSKNDKELSLEEHIIRALKDIKTGNSSLKNIEDVKNYFIRNGLCTKNEFEETWNKMCNA